MNVLHRSLFVVCVIAAALAACDKSQSAPSATPAPAPAPAPSPAPAPAPTTSTIRGTITESAPTTSVKLAGVTVSVGTRATLTDANGAFSLGDLPAGTYVVRASKTDYVDGVTTITLPGDASTPIVLGLDPEYGQLSVRRTGKIDHENPNCPGGHGNYSCDTFSFPAHHGHPIFANLYWHSSDARLELELRCDGITYVRPEGLTPKTVTFEGAVYFNFTIQENAKKNQTCELRVLHISGDPMPYIMTAQYPN